MIEPGSYVANVVVPFPASVIATAELLRAGIEKKGFTDVAVHEQPPRGWPLPTKADYFVQASWPSAPKAFDMPSAVTADKKVA